MSEHLFENECIDYNFFNLYSYDWSKLEKKSINNIFDKFKFNENEYINYIDDIKIRCKHEENIINNLEETMRFNSKINDLNEINKNLLNINYDGNINNKIYFKEWLLILSNLLKKKELYKSFLKNY